VWPKSCMDQDATWYGGRPRARTHCARWGASSPPPKGATVSQFSADVCCGQTAGWIKMPLDTEVGLGPGHCVRWGPSSPPQKKERGIGPQFSSHVCCVQTAGLIKMPLRTKVGVGPDNIVRWGPRSLPHKQRGTAPNFRPMSVMAKWLG